MCKVKLKDNDLYNLPFTPTKPVHIIEFGLVLQAIDKLKKEVLIDKKLGKCPRFILSDGLLNDLEIETDYIFDKLLFIEIEEVMQ